MRGIINKQGEQRADKSGKGKNRSSESTKNSAETPHPHLMHINSIRARLSQVLTRFLARIDGVEPGFFHMQTPPSNSRDLSWNRRRTSLAALLSFRIEGVRFSITCTNATSVTEWSDTYSSTYPRTDRCRTSNILAAVFMMVRAATCREGGGTSSRDYNDFVQSHIQSGHTTWPSSSPARYALLAPWHLKDLSQ